MLKEPCHDQQARGQYAERGWQGYGVSADMEEEMSVKQPTKHWSMKSAIEQIDKCAFECEGGPLSMNDAYIWLKGAAESGPAFWPGQGVYFEIDAIAATGQRLTQWVHFYITGCRMDSDTDGRLWTYSISYDPPGAYHYGKTHYTDVKDSRLRLTKPGDKK